MNNHTETLLCYTQVKNDIILQRFDNFIFAVDIRGCKEHTHSLVGKATLTEALMKAEEKLWRSYPFLDKKLMTDRKQGELYFDIGVEVLPLEDFILTSKHLSSNQENVGNTGSSVVGLWYLEGLACSFKATGYKSPNLFPMSTLAQYGSANAVMGKRGRHHSHIVKAQYYCGIYNLNRAQDNRSEYFRQTDPPSMPREHYKSRTNIEDVYRKELQDNRSTGNRAEIRSGGACFKDIIPFIGRMVRLSTTP
jgi:hypothetical protein